MTAGLPDYTMSKNCEYVYSGSSRAAFYLLGDRLMNIVTGIHAAVLIIYFVFLILYFSNLNKSKIGQGEVLAELVNQNDSLTKELKQKNDELEQAYWDMVNTLIGVIEARDYFTGGHSVKVCEYSVKLSRKLGLDDSQISKIMKASILHDIGKMGIPDNILLKPDSLSCDEYGTIMTHPEIGCKILGKVRGLEDILPMILYHHERMDGKGYPYGLDQERIPLGARIIAIADAYDAMTSNRPYRKALVKKEAKKRLLEGAGTQFDAELVGSFMDIIESDNVDSIGDYRRNDIERIKNFAGIM